MDISKIGYIDSYGGLISAVEARHLTEKGKVNQRLKRLDDITKSLKHCTDLGLMEASMPLTTKEADTLKTLGYVVELEAEPNLYKVSWSEDNSSLQSSESSQASVEEPSSSS